MRERNEIICTQVFPDRIVSVLIGKSDRVKAVGRAVGGCPEMEQVVLVDQEKHIFI